MNFFRFDDGPSHNTRYQAKKQKRRQINIIFGEFKPLKDYFPIKLSTQFFKIQGLTPILNFQAVLQSLVKAGQKWEIAVEKPRKPWARLGFKLMI